MSPSPPRETISAPAPSALLANRYRLDRRLAQGGMAEVWVATDTLLTRQVAVKLLKPNLAADPIVAERFRREAIAVAQLSHPNIVAVYDAIGDTVNGHHRQAVVMQLIAGKSLRQLLDEQKKLSPDLTMHIGNCVANALDAAHHAGLIHRDVKPGNILITPDGRVLLTDFGIAKGLADTEDLTHDNVMMGTAKYLSPEQVRGRKLDGRADLYSLGLVLYECLAGRVPFLGESDAETALARLNRDPTDINRLRPTLPDGLGNVVHRLLARSPDDRFESGAKLRAALADVAGTLAGNAAAAPTPSAGHPAIGRPPRVGGSPASPIQGPRARRTGQQRKIRPDAEPPARTTGSTPRVLGPLLTPPSSQRITGSVERTPHNPHRPEPRPNKRFTQTNRRPTLLVAGLIFTAIVMVIVILATMGDDTARERLPTVPLGTVASEATVADRPPATALAAPDGAAPQAMLFDPEGDGSENADVSAAFDGDPSTAWTTVCYRSSQLGGKPGVGLLLDLGTAQTGTIDATVGSQPFGVQVRSAPEGPAPTRIQDMKVDKRFERDRRGTITATFTEPVRYVSIVLVQLARDTSCSGRQFTGSIVDVLWTKG